MPESSPPRYLVKITGHRPFTKEVIHGTGVFVARNLILTCRHVVRYRRQHEPAEDSEWVHDIQIGWGQEGKDAPIPARIHRPDLQEKYKHIDLALIEVEEPLDLIEIAPWSDPGESLRCGDRITELCYAEGNYTEGPRQIDAMEHDVQVKGGFRPGSSGGVLQYATQRRFDCFALIRDSAYGESKAIRYGKIESHLKELGVELPSAPLTPVPSVAGDPLRYRALLCRQVGRIDLEGFLVKGQRQSVDITQLWVPSKTDSILRPEIAEGNPEFLLSDAVNQHRCLTILGEAGSGKSTFLKRIAYALARADLDRETIHLVCLGMPLWAPLKALESFIDSNIGHGRGYSEATDVRWIALYLAGTDEAVQCGLGYDYFDPQLRRDAKALLLLDGFDEVSAGRRRDLRQMIETAAANFQCRIVISTRPEAGEALSASDDPVRANASRIFVGVPEAAILPLDKAGIQRFIDLWTRAFPQTEAEAARQAERLRAAVERPGIARLARNTLMLTAMAVLTSNGQQLPERRAALFEDIVQWLVLSRNKGNLARAEEFRGHLANLALQMIRQPDGNPYQVSLGRAAKLIEDQFNPKPPKLPSEAAREFLDHAERETGLLTRRGTDLTFWHRYLQEYLAASRLAGMSQERGPAIQKMLKSGECPEVVRLMLGTMAPNSKEDLSLLLARLMKAAAKWALPAKAYAVGLLGTALEDLRPTRFYPEGTDFQAKVRSHWESLRDSVMPIFTDTTEAAKVPLKTRVAAAEAMGQAGDPRLHLPKDGLGDPNWRDYWEEVPAGEFWIGSQKHTKDRPDYDAQMFDDEDWKRSEPTPVKGFLIGRFPVTVFEYNEYLQRENKKPHPEMKLEEQLEHLTRPVVRVTWLEAAEYCEWAGGELPTETQWEYAARGPGNWKYPWGNDLPDQGSENLANFAMNVGEPAPVGLFPAGKQKETGILDMAGNVWEWTTDDYREGAKVVRGGSFDSYARLLRAAFRNYYGPDERTSSIGFRCVREVFA